MTHSGGAENAGPENEGPGNAGPMMSSLRDQNTVLENAGLIMQDLENAGPGIQIMSSTSTQA